MNMYPENIHFIKSPLYKGVFLLFYTAGMYIGGLAQQDLKPNLAGKS